MCNKEFTPKNYNHIYCGSVDDKNSCAYKRSLYKRMLLNRKYKGYQVVKTRICQNCGKEYDVKGKTFGGQKYCGSKTKKTGCSHLINNMRASEVSREKYATSIKTRFTICQYGAEKRGINFDLTFDEYSQFWGQPCYYCGGENKTIGLDRVNPSMGYEVGNVVSSCWDCNRMKGILTEKDFYAKIKQILDRRKI